MAQALPARRATQWRTSPAEFTAVKAMLDAANQPRRGPAKVPEPAPRPAPMTEPLEARQERASNRQGWCWLAASLALALPICAFAHALSLAHPMPHGDMYPRAAMAYLTAFAFALLGVLAWAESGEPGRG